MTDRHLQKMTRLGIYAENGEIDPRSEGRVRNSAHVEGLRTGIHRRLTREAIDEVEEAGKSTDYLFPQKEIVNMIPKRIALIDYLEDVLLIVLSDTEKVNEMVGDILYETAKEELRLAGDSHRPNLRRNMMMFRKNKSILPSHLYVEDKKMWIDRLLRASIRYITIELKDYKNLLLGKPEENELIAPWKNRFLLEQLKCIPFLERMEKSRNKKVWVLVYFKECIRKVLKYAPEFQDLFRG